MRLEYLQYLKAVADSNSISLASNRLFISQQALSKAIQMFEKELGAQLLVRGHQGVTLTEEGRYVLEKAEQVLQLMQDMEQHFSQQETQKLTGSLRVMATPFLLDHILPEAIGNFYKKYPNIQLNLVQGNEKEILTALRERSIDLGIFFRCYLDNTVLTDIEKPLIFEPFSKHYFQAILSVDSPLAKLNSVSMQQLVQYPIFLTASDTLDDYTLYKLFQRFGAKKIQMIDTYGLFTQLISNNLGVSITPNLANYVFLEKNSTIVKRPVSNHLYGYNGYVYHQDHFDNPSIPYFLQEIYNRYSIFPSNRERINNKIESEK